MTIAPSLFPGNPKRIDSCIMWIITVIDSHHLVQLFQNKVLLLQSIRKCVMLSMSLQYVHYEKNLIFVAVEKTSKGLSQIIFI